MLEKLPPIPIYSDENDVPPIPLDEQLLSVLEVASLCLNLVDIPHVFKCSGPLTLSKTQRHLNAMEKYLKSHTDHQVVVGICHFFNSRGVGSFQVYLKNEIGLMLSYSSSVCQALEKVMKAELKFENQDYYIEVSY